MRHFFVLSALCLMLGTGCDLKSLLSKKAAPSEEQSPQPLRQAGMERLRVAEAMTFNDVQFLVRTGSTEKEVLNEVQQRGLVDPIQPLQARSLATYNASANLMKEIQDPKYVLTFEEKNEYFARKGARETAQRQQIAQLEEQEDATEIEKRRQGALQQQTISMVKQQERDKQAREVAKQQYESEKRRLEYQREWLQKRINSHRSYGYSDAGKTALEWRLKENEDARNRLKAP